MPLGNYVWDMLFVKQETHCYHGVFKMAKEVKALIEYVFAYNVDSILTEN